MVKVSDLEIEGHLVTLYKIALMKLTYDFHNKLTITEPIKYIPYYDSIEQVNELFEKLLNEIVYISYFFEGKDIHSELMQTSFYEEIKGYKWSNLYFIPCEQVKHTMYEVREFQNSYHRYYTGTTLSATVKGHGIYIAAVEVDLGNYFYQLQFVMKVLIESEVS